MVLTNSVQDGAETTLCSGHTLDAVCTLRAMGSTSETTFLSTHTQLFGRAGETLTCTPELPFWSLGSCGDLPMQGVSLVVRYLGLPLSVASC